MTRRRTQIVFGIATLDLVFASFNALAQSQPMSVAVDLDRRGGDVAVTTRVVRFADLDLSRNSGINVLALSASQGGSGVGLLTFAWLAKSENADSVAQL